MEAIHRKPIKIITPDDSTVSEYLAEVWQYRNLILVFARLDFRLQFIQTRLNFLWVLLRPLMVLALFTFVFDRLMHIPGLSYPYVLFAFTGLILWNNFSFLVSNGGSVIIANQQLIKKMYFPRLILVISKVLMSLIEVGVSILLLLVLMLFLGYPVSVHIIFLPLVIIAALIPGFAVALWLCALTIRYRDLNQFVPTLIGFLIWLTPVFYPVTLIPQRYYFLVYFNPIAGIIQAFRWSMLGDTFPDIWFLPSFLFCVLSLVVGLVVFIRSQTELADHI